MNKTQTNIANMLSRKMGFEAKAIQPPATTNTNMEQLIKEHAMANTHGIYVVAATIGRWDREKK